jgi:hypothetical protein
MSQKVSSARPFDLEHPGRRELHTRLSGTGDGQGRRRVREGQKPGALLIITWSNAQRRNLIAVTQLGSRRCETLTTFSRALAAKVVSARAIIHLKLELHSQSTKG